MPVKQMKSAPTVILFSRQESDSLLSAILQIPVRALQKLNIQTFLKWTNILQRSNMTFKLEQFRVWKTCSIMNTNMMIERASEEGVILVPFTVGSWKCRSSKDIHLYGIRNKKFFQKIFVSCVRKPVFCSSDAVNTLAVCWFIVRKVWILTIRISEWCR